MLQEELKEKQCFIIDSGTFGTTPVKIEGCEISNPQNRQNNKGEADCAVWFHANKSNCPQITICANDTDIWVYGIVLMEKGHFKDNKGVSKQISVKISFQNDYININKGLELLHNDERLQRLAEDNICASAVLAVYLLSGSDYLSAFFGFTSNNFFQSLCNFLDYISPDDAPFVLTELKKGHNTLYLPETGFLKLVCCTYLIKYKNLYRHIRKTPPELYEILSVSGDNQSDDEKKTCLNG